MKLASRLILVSSAGMLITGAGVGACHRNSERTAAHAGDHDRDHDEGHDESSGSTMSETRSAAQHIANARCDRERRCNNIGADKKFASDDVCADMTRSEWANDLNDYECPQGIDQKELDQCLASIRAEDCSSPLDTLSRMSECRPGQICTE